MFGDQNPNKTQKNVNTPNSSYKHKPISPHSNSKGSSKNQTNKKGKFIEIGIKDLKVNEELYLSEISVTREEDLKRKVVETTQYDASDKTQIQGMEEVLNKPRKRDMSPPALNLPQLYEDVSRNNKLLKMQSKSQRDLSFNFKQFWPVSKNFKIADKTKSDQEKIQAAPIQKDLATIEENPKSNENNDKKRPITGASSNVNK